MDLPETRYAKTVDGVNIAYQVRGEGPAELVCVPQWINNLAIVWENPLYARS